MHKITLIDRKNFRFGNGEVLPLDGLVNVSYQSQTHNYSGHHRIIATYITGREFVSEYGFEEFKDFRDDLDKMMQIFANYR